MKKCLSSFLLFIMVCSMAVAQEVLDTTQLWYVEMNNRQHYIGIIKAEQKKQILFETREGKSLKLRKRKIKYKELFDPQFYIDEKYYPDQGNSSNSYQVNSDQVWYFMTRDRNEYTGRIIEERSRLTLMDTQVGKLAFKSRNIRYREVLDSSRIVKGEYFPHYHYANHLSFTPSGEIGNSYIQVNTISGVHGNAVFDDHFSMSAGFFPLSLIEDVDIRSSSVDGTFFWISPKFAFNTHSKGLKNSIGIIGGFSRENPFLENGNFLIAYHAMTFGNEFIKGNLGLGYGLFDGQRLRRPVVTGSVFYRAGKLKFFHFEGLMMGPAGGYAAMSIRTLSKNMAIDFGVVGMANKQLYFNRETFLLPYAKVIVSLKGRRR